MRMLDTNNVGLHKRTAQIPTKRPSRTRPDLRMVTDASWNQTLGLANRMLQPIT